MCLSLKVKLSEEDAPRSKEIAKLATEIAGVDIGPEHSLFRKRSSVLNISESGKGCACSLLTDDADWDAETWDMHQSSLPKIAQGLRKLRENTKVGFVFEALWQGEKPTEEKKISIGELANIVESGKIGTKTRYLID
jgi:hypothetical protein